MIPRFIVKTCLREVDIEGFHKIYYDQIVQELSGKTQLSFVDKEYLGGRHSRLEHSIFVFHFMDELVKHLVKKEMIDMQESLDLRAAALLHDLKHPPFSHAMEYVFGSLIDPLNPINHNQMSVNAIRKSDSLIEAIELSGANVDNVCDIINKKHQNYLILSHKTLGIDKIAYTLLDSHHTGYTISLPYFLDLFPYFVYQDGKLGIGEVRVEKIKDAQNTMQKMYSEVYLTPKVTKYKRILQKAVELYLESDYNNLSPYDLWDVGEGTLLYLLNDSKENNVSTLMERFNERGAYLCALALKIKGFSEAGRKFEVLTNEIDENALCDLQDLTYIPKKVSEIEKRVADYLKINPADILIGVSLDYKRIIPQDVILFNHLSRNEKTLFEQYPKHHQSLLERAKSAFTIQISVIPEHMELIRKNADYITEEIIKH